MVIFLPVVQALVHGDTMRKDGSVAAFVTGIGQLLVMMLPFVYPHGLFCYHYGTFGALQPARFLLPMIFGLVSDQKVLAGCAVLASFGLATIRVVSLLADKRRRQVMALVFVYLGQEHGTLGALFTSQPFQRRFSRVAWAGVLQVVPQHIWGEGAIVTVVTLTRSQTLLFVHVVLVLYPRGKHPATVWTVLDLGRAGVVTTTKVDQLTGLTAFRIC